MIISVHQPEYLPWLGFFDRINKSDIFVVLDDVGYQKNGFINRNKIKTKDGYRWITIPVKDRSPNKKINEVLIDSSKRWQESQLSIIKENYSNAPYFKDYYDFLKSTFDKKWKLVSDLDIYLMENMNKFLGIEACIKKSSDIEIKSEKTQRLVDICKYFNADTYLSGPGGKDYMDLELFEKEGVKVVFSEFLHSEYNQMFNEQGFLKGMSVIDLLFNCGPQSLNIITGKK